MYGLIVWLSSVTSFEYSTELWTGDEFKKYSFCSNWCICTSNDDDDFYRISCSQDGTEDQVMIKIKKIVGTFGNIACENVTSLISNSNSDTFVIKLKIQSFVIAMR